jgi:hypothetical protein
MGRSSGVVQQDTAAEQAAEALAQLLERVATKLPSEVLVLVLRPLPVVELARLACVHKAFWVALQSLRQQHPGRRYAPPPASVLLQAQRYSRLVHAGWFGDVSVIQSMLAAGVDEDGSLLLQARENDHTGRQVRTVDRALFDTASEGHIEAAELLFRRGRRRAC